MNITTIKKFLLETKFAEVDYRVYSEYCAHPRFHPIHGGWQCYSFTTAPAEGEMYGKTLLIKFKKGLFDGRVVVYQSGCFLCMFKSLFLKWAVKRLIKKAFAKHFDEVIENWNNKKK